MYIDWCKCILQSRCRLNSLNLKNDYFDNRIGVYVIWSGNDKSKIVSIGRGIIRDELVKMKNNKSVQDYGPDLFVTWAEIPKDSLEGVEAYLCSKLNPLDHHTTKSVDLIDVNLP